VKTMLVSAFAATMILGCSVMTADKAPLLGQEWIIEDIAGGGVIDDSQPSLLFLADGQLAGSGSCNRIIGSYQLDDKQLTIKPAGTTMMMCPEALMNQENKLLKLLPTIKSYQIDKTGALVLTTANGEVIVARHHDVSVAN
jgi:heat shock protein HslJ